MTIIETRASRFEGFTDFQYLNTVFQYLYRYSLNLNPAVLWLDTRTTLPEDIQAKPEAEIKNYVDSSVSSLVNDVETFQGVEIFGTTVLSPLQTHPKISGSYSEVMLEIEGQNSYLENAMTRIFNYSIRQRLLNLVLTFTDLTSLEFFNKSYQGTRLTSSGNFATSYNYVQGPAGIIPVGADNFYTVISNYTSSAYLQCGPVEPAKVIRQTVSRYEGLPSLPTELVTNFAFSRVERGNSWSDSWEVFNLESIQKKYKMIEQFILYSFPFTVLDNNEEIR
jgi:hypothetical protein